MAEPLPHILRSDAEDNRVRVLEAARELFSERGLEVPMRAIARRAGVGPATLYRRYPTKQALIEAAFTDELRACRAIVAEGCADPDPWRGFSSVLFRIGELNAHHQGFIDAFMSTFPDAVDFAAHRAGMLRALAELCRRAQATGAMRSDIVIDDLVLVLMAGRGVSAATDELRVAAARRFAALAIEGFRATGAEEPLPPRAHVASFVLTRP
ncbi:TetR/AcrR family transcriptional regulator [Herbiconiux ginsengi]|nr:TetR/AcrR family transcriptional regulator [Herbiconiux ginsengi]